MPSSRHNRDPEVSVSSSLPDVDPGLRAEVDPDPLVEQMVERLRGSLSDMVALDEYGRPLAWRHVVRLALGPTIGRLRDAETCLTLMKQVMDLPDAGELGPRQAAGSTGWPPFRGAVSPPGPVSPA